MAQLRDAKTSALILEGTPLELALIAEELGRDEVLFDDVGAGFNPAAVIKAQRENVDGLAAATRTAKATADRKALEAALREARAAGELDPNRVRAAAQELERARAKAEV